MKKLLNNNFKGIQHIGIPVTRIEYSKDFYQRLGFESVMEKTFPLQGGNITAVMMRREDAVIELYQLPSSELGTIRNRTDGSIDHIAFSVTDIDAAFRELKATGENIIEDSPVRLDFWENGCKYFAIRGPDGEKLEFNEIL